MGADKEADEEQLKCVCVCVVSARQLVDSQTHTTHPHTLLNHRDVCVFVSSVFLDFVYHHFWPSVWFLVWPISQLRKLQFLYWPSGSDPGEWIPFDIHVKMFIFTVEIKLFTAWYKNSFGLHSLISAPWQPYGLFNVRTISGEII